MTQQVFKMAEYIKFKDEGPKRQVFDLHKKIYFIFLNGFVSGCFFMLSLYFMNNQEPLIGFIFLLASIMGTPWRKPK